MDGNMAILEKELLENNSNNAVKAQKINLSDEELSSIDKEK